MLYKYNGFGRLRHTDLTTAMAEDEFCISCVSEVRSQQEAVQCDIANDGNIGFVEQGFPANDMLKPARIW